MSSIIHLHSKILQSLKDQIDDLITSLPYHQTTLTEVILILLGQADLDHWRDILNFLYDRKGEMQIQWANQVTTDILQVEMSHLASKETGVHFLAKTTTESKLKDFNIQEMAVTMQRVGSDVWQLFSKLLEVDPYVNYKRNWA